MGQTVVGVFRSRDQGEKAIKKLRDSGFEREISVVAKDEGRGGRGGEGGNGGRRGDNDFEVAGGVTDGVGWGAAIGGGAGLLAGAGALAIPGIGPILAAGPIAAALSGAVTGGVAGGLLDFGIPEERGRQLEEEVKRGNILALVRTSDEKADKASSILKEHGASNVETHRGGDGSR